MRHGRAVTVALGVAVVAAFALSTDKSYAQSGYGPNDAPNPYRFDYGWAKLPKGRTWGAAVERLGLRPLRNRDRLLEVEA